MIDTSKLIDLLTSESAGVWEWDLETGYVEFNDAWKKTMGFRCSRAGHFTIDFWLDLLHPDEFVSIMHEIFRCRDGLIPVFYSTHRLMKQSKDWITVLSIGSLIHSEEDPGSNTFLCTQFVVSEKASELGYLRFQRDIGIVLSATTDLNVAVKKSLEAILKFNSNIDAGGVYLLNHETDTFELFEYSGLSEHFIEENRLVPADSTMGILIRSEGPVYFQYDDYSPFPQEHEEGSQLLINAVFPMKHLGILEAALFLASETHTDFPASAFDGIEGVVQNISGTIGRIRAENRMKASEEKHRILLERIESPILAVNADMKILFHNKALETIFDCRFIGNHDLFSVFDAVFARFLTVNFAKVLTSGNHQRISIDHGTNIWDIVFSSVPNGAIAIMRDITTSARAKKELDFKIRIESLLVDISTGFIKKHGAALDSGINDALFEIGSFLDVDRSYLFQVDNKARTVSNTHEWCVSTVKPKIDKLQDLAFSLIPWWMEALERHETLNITAFNELPEQALVEKVILGQQEILSTVVIPIVQGKNLIGFLGFDSILIAKKWNKDIIDLLRIVGDAIGNALERNRMQLKLQMMYQKADKEAKTNAILLKEVNHRVKNNLSEIIGLFYAQIRFIKQVNNLNDFLPDMISRVQGLATVHSMLSYSSWEPLKISELARQILSNTTSAIFGTKSISSIISDTNIKVDSRQAHSLALVFNELVINSTKHALINSDKLLIEVDFHHDGSGNIIIKYRDNGPGFSEKVLQKEQSGLGLSIITNMISKNLQGHLSMFNDNGAVTEIVFQERQRNEGSELK
ncbi:MAG: PAS domain-containing protein [Candidatus Sabulitectum sp.]|nr:PAS domain-containing protein [Candidatus Sabulitectum sp.]